MPLVWDIYLLELLLGKFKISSVTGGWVAIKMGLVQKPSNSTSNLYGYDDLTLKACVLCPAVEVGVGTLKSDCKILEYFCILLVTATYKSRFECSPHPSSPTPPPTWDCILFHKCSSVSKLINAQCKVSSLFGTSSHYTACLQKKKKKKKKMVQVEMCCFNLLTFNICHKFSNDL